MSRWKVASLALALALSAGVAGPGWGHQTTAPCDGQVRGGERIVTVVPVAGGNVLYIDRAQVGEPYIVGFWLYMESNGHPGLQTKAGSESAIYEGFRENCTIAHDGVTQPDTFLF